MNLPLKNILRDGSFNKAQKARSTCHGKRFESLGESDCFIDTICFFFTITNEYRLFKLTGEWSTLTIFCYDPYVPNMAIKDTKG
jgi:hypothetical protein